MSSSALPDPIRDPSAIAVGRASSPMQDAMRFGLFGGARARRGEGDPARGFRDYIDTCVEAEALGFESTFLVEHDFSGTGQASASLDLLAWVAARTTTMRLGTAVIVLPWHNPVLLAERAATLDLLSGGRLDFGVGKGYRHSEFAGFGMPYEEAEERFEEALQVVIRAWISDARFSHRGKFWHYEDVIVDPPPSQRPHPPIWIAASKPDSIRSVAGRGCKLLLDQFASIDTVGERLALFRAECEARGRAFDPRTSRSRVTSTSRVTLPTHGQRWRGSLRRTLAWSLFHSIRTGAINHTSRPTPRHPARPRRARCTARLTGSRPHCKPCTRSASDTSSFTAASQPHRASSGSRMRSCPCSAALTERRVSASRTDRFVSRSVCFVARPAHLPSTAASTALERQGEASPRGRSVADVARRS